MAKSTMAKTKTKAKSKSTIRCTCDPNDLLFDKCACGKTQPNTSGDGESWIDDYTTLYDEETPDNNGLALSGEGAGLNNSTELSSRESSIGHGVQDAHQDEDPLDWEFEIGNNFHGIGDDYDPCADVLKSMTEHFDNNPRPQDGQHTDLSNNSPIQQDSQYTECNNSPIQQDSQYTECDNTLDEQVMQNTSGLFAQNFSNPFEFSQERADYNNIMNASSGFGDFGNSSVGIFSPTDGLTQPINTTAQHLSPVGLDNLDFSMDFSKVDFSNFTFDPNANVFGSGSMNINIGNGSEVGSFSNGPNVIGFVDSPQMPMSAQSGATFSNTDRAAVDQSQNQANFSGHSNRKAPTQSLISQRPVNQPQMLTAANKKKQQQNLDDAFERDRAMARANVHTARESGQDLFGVYQKTQQSAQRFSTSAFPAVPATQRLSANQLGKQPVVQQPFSSPTERTPLSANQLGKQPVVQQPFSSPAERTPLSANQLGKQPVVQQPFSSPAERTLLSANQLGKQPVRQTTLSSPAGPTPSRKRTRPADIQVPSQAPKRARTDASIRPPVADEVESNTIIRGRMVSELLKTEWLDMTHVEKARLILPMISGTHPLQFEKDEMSHGLSYGAARQRKALDKTMKLSAAAVADSRAAIAKKTPVPAEDLDEDDEEAMLEARLAEIQAKKKAKAAEEKRQRTNDKRAATMRRKRLEEKDIKEKAKQDAEEQKKKDKAEEQRKAEEEQQRLAEEQQRLAEEQQRLAEEQFRFQNPYAHLGYMSVQPFGP
ncbi:hypothetical protein P171DRAFT_442678 [Karstenula rhodostoma CBS 690.94]|uniref:Uncharacterized protein n=1 Tax=Karstenula rhodostoma CBS 690.94 TaxID=1392251 RepID=A0A9P4PN98_9PLEO|nr:hypothetical protein P171DRAFT_442678 [Karstenula rhodostoma CBS 690.94]